jgi:hypothetical protein
MAILLRKGVSLGAGGVIGSRPEQTFQSNAAFYAETNTTWTKIWADWPTLQPTATTPLGQNFGGLDSQVQAANAAGRGVILTVYRCPTWAGTTSTGPGGRQAVFHVPNDTSTTGPWAQLLQHLMVRYSSSNPGAQGTVWFIEICNEPNVQMWPQQNSDGSLAMGCKAAQMMETAQAIHDGMGGALPWILGPGTSDTVAASSPTVTRYDEFVTQVLETLRSVQWVAGPNTIWSHHNYTDIEDGRFGTPQSNPSGFCIAQDVRARLANQRYHWQGWQGAGESPPLVFLTEGGTRWPVLRDHFGQGLSDAQVEGIQASVIGNAHLRLQNTGDGVGIGMFFNYLFYTDPSFDAGLRYALPPGNARSAYSTWAGFSNP